jgi:putative SOS response-associated peptidase YedK
VCGRYTLAIPDPAAIRARFPVGESVEIRPRFNVAPGDEVLAVTTDRHGAPRGELLRWGLVPSWAKGPQLGLKMINARVETAAEKPAFRTALQRFRCLIIADGFYEWQRPDHGPKRPFHIRLQDGEPFAFAGLWSVWRPPAGDAGGRHPADSPIRSCSILTTAADSTVTPLHDRMPVILEPGAERAWLDATTPASVVAELLRVGPAQPLAIREVGTAVNDARHDEPDCLDAPDAAPQPTLFAI